MFILGLFAYVIGGAISVGPGIWLTRTRRGGWLAVSGVILWTLVTGLPYLLLVGLPYTAYFFAAASCVRLPAIGTVAMAAYSYELPGDSEYQPSILSDRFFCTAADAERAGFHRIPSWSP